MNRLRKIAAWLWLIKERMVLAVMVLFLCYRIYAVVYTGEGEGIDLPLYPKPGLGPDIPQPGTPPPMIRDRVGQDYTLGQRSPFYYRERAPGTSSGANTEADIFIQVLLIREITDGQFKARIRTDKTRKWYAEGEFFESYELIEIDPETECCVIHAENLGRSITVCIE